MTLGPPRGADRSTDLRSMRAARLGGVGTPRRAPVAELVNDRHGDGVEARLDRLAATLLRGGRWARAMVPEGFDDTFGLVAGTSWSSSSASHDSDWRPPDGRTPATREPVGTLRRAAPEDDDRRHREWFSRCGAEACAGVPLSPDRSTPPAHWYLARRCWHRWYVGGGGGCAIRRR